MDLQKKIAQLFILGFQGTEITPNSLIAQDIRKRNLGGVILFDYYVAGKTKRHNIISAPQVKNLINQLQHEAHSPLLVSVDQEGGKVTRLKEQYGFLPTRSAGELGQNSDTQATYTSGIQTAQLLADLGFNVNFAPVVDVNSNQDNPVIGKLHRSFSSNPEQVYQHAFAWIQSHRDTGIMTCLKHFPGHGSSKADSHLGFVDITASWDPTELLPYEQLIKNGMVDSVMTGHLFNSQLDDSYPATLSQNVVTGILRKDLEFDGLIFTDDMQMKAITDRYGLEDAVCLALAAGVDSVVIGNNLHYQPDILEHLVKAIVKAVETGKLDEQRIEMSFQRMQRFRNSGIA